MKEDINLSAGYDNFIQRENKGPDPIHSLLDALIHLKKTSVDENVIKADVVRLQNL